MVEGILRQSRQAVLTLKAVAANPAAVERAEGRYADAVRNAEALGLDVAAILAEADQA
jgi:hypothetical protein